MSPLVCPFNIRYQRYILSYITGDVFQNPTLRHPSFPDLCLNLFSSLSSLALVRPGRSPTQASIIRACWNFFKEKKINNTNRILPVIKALIWSKLFCHSPLGCSEFTMLFGILSHFITQLTKTKQKTIIIDLGNEGEMTFC